MPRKGQSLKSWATNSVSGVAGIGVVWIYGIGHLVMRVPLARLWEPYGLISILTLLLAPSMYWAITRHDGVGQNVKERIFVSGGYLWSTSFICIVYMGKFGVIPPDVVVLVCILLTITIVLGGVAGYYVSKDAPKESDDGS
jgi:hypothetical protein